MKTIERLLINICSADLAASENFYTKLFDFTADYHSDWFVHLISKNKKLELGIVDSSHEIVPKAYQGQPNGYYITFIVDNTDELLEIAKNEGFEIVQKPQNTFYGQRRLLLKDPDGTLVDVSSPIPDVTFQ